MGKREERIVQGNGGFVDDFVFPGLVHLVFVGSPLAHARINAIDIRKALELRGVLTIITGQDLTRLMNPLPPTSDLGAAGWDWHTPVVYPMAVDRVRFYGEPFAAVVAEDVQKAHRAADLIEVNLEALPTVIDPMKAMEPGSPLLYDEWGDNIQAHKLHRFGDVDGAFEEADRVLPFTWREGRASGFPIEPQGCIAWLDAMTGVLSAWGGFQSPFRSQQAFSHVLRTSPDRIRISATNIGGAFGNKIQCWKHTVVGLAAMLTRRPVKWMESHREFIATGPHQRDVLWSGEAAFKDDGRVLGIKGRFVQDLGVEISNRSYAAASLIAACCAIPNAYPLKGLEIDAYGVVTNKPSYGAYRGYGKDKGIKLMERIMDWVARECELTPEEVRLRNFIPADGFPYRQITNYVYDSGNYHALMERLLELADIDSWRKQQEEHRSKNRYLGLGVAFVVEPAGVAVANESSGLTQARVRLMPDGLIEVHTDRTEIGQGAEASHAIVISDIVGASVKDVVVKPVTSDLPGMGPVSSRGSVYSLSALAVAAKKLKSKLLALSAVFLDDDPGNIVIDEGGITSKNHPENRLNFRDLAQKVYFRPGPRGLSLEMLMGNDFLPDVTATWFSPNTAQNRNNPYTTFCYSADFAVVEVDIETGTTQIMKHLHVHDAGNVVSEELVEGQIHGGVVQGIGEALSEELLYGRDGSLLSDSLTDYVMPAAPDAPLTEVHHMVTPSPYTELGTKGMAEAPIISGKAVVISAIEDALSPFKIQVKEAPASSERIRRWILEAQSGNSGG